MMPILAFYLWLNIPLSPFKKAKPESTNAKEVAEAYKRD